MGNLESLGDAVTGGILGRAVEPLWRASLLTIFAFIVIGMFAMIVAGIGFTA